MTLKQSKAVIRYKAVAEAAMGVLPILDEAQATRSYFLDSPQEDARRINALRKALGLEEVWNGHWVPSCKCIEEEGIEPVFMAVVPGDVGDGLVDVEGVATNRWADGTAGVPDDIKPLFEACEEVYCPSCLSQATWKREDY